MSRACTRVFWALLLVALLCGGVARGQEDVPLTLHVYTNLMQIPVLVLTPGREKMRAVPPERFYVSLDDGPRFKATHVRVEGDDPIALSILLDVNGNSAELMRKAEDAIGGMAPVSVGKRDRVSVYELDCGLMRTMHEAPADAEKMKAAVGSALKDWRERRAAKKASPCKERAPLWDAIALITHEMRESTGRRVMLVFSDGTDTTSRHGWSDVRFAAQSAGVAIFGMKSDKELERTIFYHSPNREDLFRSICELTGGLVMTSDDRVLPEHLRRFGEMVRERYIVEFPRPNNSTAGEHAIEISIAKTEAFIRPAGTSVALPDPAVLADPNTVPNDPTLEPVYGKRRVLKPK